MGRNIPAVEEPFKRETKVAKRGVGIKEDDEAVIREYGGYRMYFWPCGVVVGNWEGAVVNI